MYLITRSIYRQYKNNGTKIRNAFNFISLSALQFIINYILVLLSFTQSRLYHFTYIPRALLKFNNVYRYMLIIELWIFFFYKLLHILFLVRKTEIRWKGGGWRQNAINGYQNCLVIGENRIWCKAVLYNIKHLFKKYYMYS